MLEPVPTPAIVAAARAMHARASPSLRALHRHAEAGDVDELRRLLAAGEDPNGRSLPGLWTPLHYAAWKGHGPCVAALLVAGAKVNLTNDHGSIALHHAACNGHADVAAALIEAGSGANFSDGYWRTPFSLALNRGHRRVFKLLLRAGAHLDAGRRPSAAAAAFVRAMRARGGWAAHVRRHRRVWAAVVGKCAGCHIPEVLEVDIAAFLAPEGGS